MTGRGLPGDPVPADRQGLAFVRCPDCGAWVARVRRAFGRVTTRRHGHCGVVEVRPGAEVRGPADH